LVGEQSDHPFILSSPEVEIFLYKALDGSSVSQAELSVRLAAEAGKALAELTPHAASFNPTGVLPQGDLGFIAGLLRATKERDELLASHPIASEMERIVSDGELSRALERSTSGVVHGDYFFENVLANQTRTEICGVLDFGDAYIGAIANDVLIGAMEFSVLEDESWDLDCFDAFLRAHKSWLRREGLTAVIAKKLLLANCVRFAVYTLPFSHAEGISIEYNKYIARFIKLLSTDLGQRVEKAVES
jgi:Ser/Thr protein kinase RdoA (MazF antagonist)